MACSNAHVHEGATVWLLACFLRGMAKSFYQPHPSSVRTHATTGAQKTKRSQRTSAFKKRFSPYATIEAVNEADNNVRDLRQYRSTVQEYADGPAERALKCGDVFDNEELIRLYVEGLNEDNLRSVQHYLSTQRLIRIYALIALAV